VRFLVGGYTAESDGKAVGVGMLLAGAPDDTLAGGSLAYTGAVAQLDSPSWVAKHPTLDVFYAALEKRGAVQAFQQTGETSYAPLGPAVPAGEATCHIEVAPQGDSLVAACWNDGRIVSMAVDAAGVPSSPKIADAANDPYMQDRPSRGHQTRFLPDGLIVTTDMGLDLVRFWRESPTGGLRPVGQVVLPLGSGPRHMVLHPSGYLYVLTELSREVFVLAPDDTRAWRVVSATALGSPLADDTAAEITLSRDAHFVYAGIRGSNTLSTLRVRGSGGELAPVALVDAGVNWPRHHVVSRDTLLVAGQRSDEVASITLDERTGVPGRVRHRAEVPSPTCLLAL
jgi:6-phosphogluconolactonase